MNASRAVQIEKNWYKLTDEKEQVSFGSVTAYTIENSSEFWIELISFSFITEDGIHICDPKQTVYGYNKDNAILGQASASSVWKPPTNWLYFSNPDARNRYILNLKPKSVLTTIDRVEIFPGDNIWCVDEKYNIKMYFVSKDPNTSINLNGAKPFKHKNNAEEWVLQNKPLICLKDVMDMSNTTYAINLSDSNKGRLRVLAQSRLTL